ncbi:MAG: glucosaminidase domain-containing protein [Prevotella sp.]|nr:glucosaminidase domain-containing protein [Prevotella sp.]MDY3851911.1 glucosaminidase domain-containing protein [Prevotella sp.]
MRRFFISLFLVAYTCIISAQTVNAKFQTYINQHKDLAILEMLKYRIPASITLAQGLLESAAGQSELVRKGNNHFGIKCHDWLGARTYHNDDETNECFRVYNNAKESYEDHSKFLKRPRYQRLFSLSPTDYKGWAHGLKDCGYATNPRYAHQLIGIIELYKLYQFDTATTYDKFMAEHAGSNQMSPRDLRLHPIHIYNKNYYLTARNGDTFQSLGKELNLSYKSLAKNNERHYQDQLKEGEIIYLKKKQKRADKAFMKRPHQVKPGESLYSIAQMYGIRLKSLYKLNGFTPDHQIYVGELIFLY